MFDLNITPSDEELFDIMGDDIFNLIGTYGENINLESSSLNSIHNQHQNYVEKGQDKSNFEPFVGQTFLSEDEAWIFYQKYAHLHGFSIRKDQTEKRDGHQIIRRDFFCHRGRTQPLKEIDPNKEQRNSLSSKCNCKAHLRIKLRRCNEIYLKSGMLLLSYRSIVMLYCLKN